MTPRKAVLAAHPLRLALLATLLGLTASAQQIKVTGEDDLKKRRTERNHGYLNTIPSVLNEQSQTIDYRYVWMLCSGNSPCMAWRLVDKPERHWERDPDCKWTKVVDRLLVEQSQCTMNNYEIRLAAEACQKWASTGRDKPFSGASLSGGAVGKVLKVFQPGNPDGYGADWGLYEQFPSCANSLGDGQRHRPEGRAARTRAGHRHRPFRAH